MSLSKEMESTVELVKSKFQEEKYVECKSLLETTLKASTTTDDDVKIAKLWLRKCNTHLPKEEQSAAATAPVVKSAPAPAPVQQQHVSANVRFEWFQSPSSLTFTYFVKGRKEDDVSISLHPTKMDMTIRISDDRDYSHSLDPFFAEIIVDSLKISVRPVKVEVTIEKKNPFQWPALEALPAEVGVKQIVTKTENVDALPATASQLQYPNSKGKDWTKLKLDDDEEDEEKKKNMSGDESLTKMFQKVYKGASDEQRLAMMKSYQESNGTVLSCNWNDVKDRKVEGGAPAGMEAKSYRD